MNPVPLRGPKPSRAPSLAPRAARVAAVRPLVADAAVGPVYHLLARLALPTPPRRRFDRVALGSMLAHRAPAGLHAPRLRAGLHDVVALAGSALSPGARPSPGPAPGSGWHLLHLLSAPGWFVLHPIQGPRGNLLAVPASIFRPPSTSGPCARRPGAWGCRPRCGCPPCRARRPEPAAPPPGPRPSR